MSSKGQRKKMQQQHLQRASQVPRVGHAPAVPFDPTTVAQLPVTYQQVDDFFGKVGEFQPFLLRRETMLRIEKITGIPLICYVTKTQNVQPIIPAAIDDNDLVGFDDLIALVKGDAVDVLIISNGGAAETTERIVRMLRPRFRAVRYFVPANAYSAATLMCFSGDAIVMGLTSSLGPVDPQISGVPARAILRAFEAMEERLKQEGPQALTAYLPLINKYDLHILEICKSVQELSDELAHTWLKAYMLKDMTDSQIAQVVKFFSDYDIHKSHGRSIGREQARAQGLKIVNAESIDGLNELLRSLYNQYVIWFDKSPFYKMFEDARGTNWGRQVTTVNIPLTQKMGVPFPQANPGPGRPTN